MRLHAYRLRNYRRLRDVVVELDDQISIFVGANNSGKTSTAQGLQMMIEGKKSKFKLFDFSAPLWKTFDEIGEAAPDADNPYAFDAFFHKMGTDLHSICWASF